MVAIGRVQQLGRIDLRHRAHTFLGSGQKRGDVVGEVLEPGGGQALAFGVDHLRQPVKHHKAGAKIGLHDQGATGGVGIVLFVIPFV